MSAFPASAPWWTFPMLTDGQLLALYALAGGLVGTVAFLTVRRAVRAIRCHMWWRRQRRAIAMRRHPAGKALHVASAGMIRDGKLYRYETNTHGEWVTYPGGDFVS